MASSSGSIVLAPMLIALLLFVPGILEFVMNNPISFVFIFFGVMMVMGGKK